MEIKAITVEISKLMLGPDDMLVIRFPKEMRLRRIEGVLPHIRAAIPKDIPTLLLHGDIELTVVSKDGTLSAK